MFMCQYLGDVGAHTVGKLRECLRILKVVILEHYSRKDQSQQLAGRTGSTPTSTMSSKPAGTEDTNTTPSGGGMEIPTVIVDRCVVPLDRLAGWRWF